MPRSAPRIAVLSTHDLVRHGVYSMLGGLGPSVQVTFHLDPGSPVDVVIVDATATSPDDVEDLEAATAASTAPVLVLTSGQQPDGFARWDRPVHALLTVSATADEVLDAVKGALRAARDGAGEREPSAPSAAANGLSRREAEVMTLVAAGLSNGEIAEELFLGLNTVKTYIRTAYRKIGVSTRSQAVIWALEHGLGADGVATRGEPAAELAWEGARADDVS